MKKQVAGGQAKPANCICTQCVIETETTTTAAPANTAGATWFTIIGSPGLCLSLCTAHEPMWLTRKQNRHCPLLHQTCIAISPLPCNATLPCYFPLPSLDSCESKCKILITTITTITIITAITTITIIPPFFPFHTPFPFHFSSSLLPFPVTCPRHSGIPCP